MDATALRMVCVDEADAIDNSALGELPESVSRVLIGATVGKAVGVAVESGWMTPPVVVDYAGTVREWTVDDLPQALCPPGIVCGSYTTHTHRPRCGNLCVLTSPSFRVLLALAATPLLHCA